MPDDGIIRKMGGRRQAVELRQGQAEHILEPVVARLTHARDETVEMAVLQRRRVEQAAVETARPKPPLVGDLNHHPPASTQLPAAARPATDHQYLYPNECLRLRRHTSATKRWSASLYQSSAGRVSILTTVKATFGFARFAVSPPRRSSNTSLTQRFACPIRKTTSGKTSRIDRSRRANLRVFYGPIAPLSSIYATFLLINTLLFPVGERTFLSSVNPWLSRNGTIP